MIFVTGATGFLGHHLIPALTQAGYQVKALVRPTSSADFLRQHNAETVVGDVLDRDSLM
ncbi:MAG: NAD-dependent epimerase/dehydratase family protein, partial [Chloroflexota bacterium]